MAHFLTLFLLLFLGFLPLTPERPRCAATGTGDRETGLAGPPPVDHRMQALEGYGCWMNSEGTG